MSTPIRLTADQLATVARESNAAIASVITDETGTDTRQISAVADQAYGIGCSASTDEERAYAAGVEDLARWLTGRRPSNRFDAVLDAIRTADRVAAHRR